MGSDPFQEGVRPLLVLVLLLAGCARAQIVPTPHGAASASVAPPMQELPVGEKLEYQISWWGIPVGSVALGCTPAASDQKVERELRKTVKLTCTGRSNPYLEAFYPVRVELTSFVDPESRVPQKFQATVRRRFRHHESIITFDWKEGTAFHQLPKKRSATVPIQPATHDGISLLYYARMLPFRVGETIPLEVTADGKNWHLAGEVTRTGRVDLKKLGKWPAVEGAVELAYPVPFFQGAKAWIWFSSDGKRLPLLARIHSRIGPVTVVLTKRYS